MTMKPIYQKFGTPAELVSDNDLSLSQKFELLRKWKSDEEALLRGANEGLQSGKQNNLKDVQIALLSLKEKYPDEYEKLTTLLSQAEFNTMSHQAGAALGTQK